MFWLLRFRGETIGDTLALWINAIVWQIHKLLYKISHPSATKRDFVSYILSRKQHLHWTSFPIDLGERHYYDRTVRIWMDAVGITWIYFTHPSEHPAHWLDGMGSGQIGFDIGAHRGYWTILYQNRVSPGGIIFAWEPNSKNYRLLIQNLAKNKISHVIPLRLAAWREGTVIFVEEVSDKGISSFLSKVSDTKRGDTLATSIDNLVEALALPRLDWIKMDIEGAEVEALKGARQTLQRYKPTLWIEFHDTLGEIKDLLAEADYEVKEEVHHGSTPFYQEVGYLWAVPKGAAP